VVVRGEADDRPTSARYSLANPEEIGAFLEELSSAGEPPRSPRIEEPDGVEAL
jgi:hypothetical protein